MPRLTLDFVPSTFEELYKHYYPYVARLVATSGIPNQDVDDVTQSLLTGFFEKGVLEDFDPDYTSHYQGTARRAMFRTFLSGFVKTYVRHYRDRIQIQARREPTLLNAPSTSAPDAPEWYAELAPAYEEPFDVLSDVELVNDIRWQLSVADSMKTRGKCDFSALFSAVLEQSYRLGRVDVNELSEKFDVSKTTIQNWLKRMRSQVQTVIEQ